VSKIATDVFEDAEAPTIAASPFVRDRSLHSPMGIVVATALCGAAVYLGI
jgi:hypothetical protein